MIEAVGARSAHSSYHLLFPHLSLSLSLCVSLLQRQPRRPPCHSCRAEAGAGVTESCLRVALSSQEHRGGECVVVFIKHRTYVLRRGGDGREAYE